MDDKTIHVLFELYQLNLVLVGPWYLYFYSCVAKEQAIKI